MDGFGAIKCARGANGSEAWIRQPAMINLLLDPVTRDENFRLIGAQNVRDYLNYYDYAPLRAYVNNINNYDADFIFEHSKEFSRDQFMTLDADHITALSGMAGFAHLQCASKMGVNESGIRYPVHSVFVIEAILSDYSKQDENLRLIDRQNLREYLTTYGPESHYTGTPNWDITLNIYNYLADRMELRRLDDTGDSLSGNEETSAFLKVGFSKSFDLEHNADKDWTAIFLKKGESYEFSMDKKLGTTSLDPYLSLFDSKSQLVAFDDDSGPGTNSLIKYIANDTGIYYLEAKSFNGSSKGSYTIKSTLIDDFLANKNTDGQLLIGSPKIGKLEVKNDHDWFSIDLVKGVQYNLAMTKSQSAASLDTELWLKSSDGLTVAHNDDVNPSNRNSLINYTPSKTGKYYLDAGSFASASFGEYTVTATQVI